MWYTFKEIHIDSKLQDKVHILLNVHDQLTTACSEDIAEEWRTRLDDIMTTAGKVIVKSGILKAETNISDVWTK